MTNSADRRPVASTLRVLATLAGKDLRLLCRDRFALFWVLLFPLLYGLFFGSVFASATTAGGVGTAPIRIAVVDRDGSAASQRLVARLADHPSLQLVGGPHEAAELAEARVRKGECSACVTIPAGYGGSAFWLFGASGARFGDAAPFDLGIDPTRRAEAGMLQGILLQTAFVCLAERLAEAEILRGELQRVKAALLADEGLGVGLRLALQTGFVALDRVVGELDPQALARLPDAIALDRRLHLRELTASGAVPRSSFEVMFPSASVWGLMSIVLSFAIMLVRERTQGTLLRLSTAPFGPVLLLAGKALGCFLACMLSMSFLLAFGHLLLGVRLHAPLLGIVAMACTAFCFTGMMLVAAVLGRSEQAVTGAAWGVMLPLAMIGGGMIPLVAMPPWLASLSDVSPIKWGIFAIEGAVWRGFGFAELALPGAVLVAVGSVGFVVGVAVFRRASV